MSSVNGINSPPITGLYNNSGMDIEGIIAKLIAAESKPISLLQQQQTKIKNQQTAYTNVQSKVQALLDKIKVLTKRDILTGSTVFDAMKGTSSDSTIATATATGSAAAQTINLEVKSLPTATRAVSTTGVGKLMTGATTLSSLGVTDGTFTVFANGNSYSISVDDSETVSTVLNRINSTVPNTYINNNPTVVNGKVVVDYNGGASTNITFGAVSGDTTNFLTKMGLTTATDDNVDTITASKIVSTIDLNQDITTAAANMATNVTSGTFTINGVSFTTTGKSLNQIITDINNNADVKVTANYNATTNKLELTAKNSGSALISMSNGTSNFLTAMGLTGASAQTAGTNAEFVLNGTTMYSNSTSVDESVTGLVGVTLNLNKAAVGSTIQLTVGRDADAAVTAIQDVVKAYNEAITLIDQQTNAQSGGVLAGESRLLSLRNQVRSLFSTSVGALGSTAYDSLQQVGITTGPVQSSGSVKATAQLQFDSTLFKTALTTSPDTVKKLFIARDLVAGSTGDDNMDGIFTQIQNTLSDKIYKDANGNDAYGALYNGGDSASGLFPTFQTSATTRIKKLDESIERAQDRLDARTATLRKQFTAMDQLIGQYQQQGNAVTGLINQLNANSNSN